MADFNPLFDKLVKEPIASTASTATYKPATSVVPEMSIFTAASAERPPLSPISGRPMVACMCDEDVPAWVDLEGRIVIPMLKE